MPNDQAVTVAEAVPGYLYSAYRHMRFKTYRETARLFDHDILPAIGNRPIDRLRRSEVIAMHETIAARAPVVANRAVSALSGLLSWAIDRDLAAVNQAHRVRRVREEPRDTVATLAELVRLFTLLPYGRSGQAIRFIILTGCRPGEAVNLEWSHLSLRDKTWTKPASLSKNGRKTIVPLSAGAIACLPPARDALAAISVCKTRVFQVPYITLRRTWYRVRDEAGLPRLQLRDFRRTFISRLIAQGATPVVVAALAGQRDPSTTLKHYTVIPIETLRDALSLPAYGEDGQS